MKFFVLDILILKAIFYKKLQEKLFPLNPQKA
jgi:hypothetical protein